METGHRDGILDELFEGAPEELVDLLKSMLTYNPVFRPPAQVLLGHRAFDGIRAKSVEYTLESYNAEQLKFDVDAGNEYEFESIDEW